jgi:hypothetical protein
VCEGTGGVDFAEETIFLVSALGLWGESAWANGEENGSSGAGGVEKRGLWAALQAEGLRRGEEVVLQIRSCVFRHGIRRKQVE